MQNLRYDNEKCASVPYERPTPLLLAKLREIQHGPREDGTCGRDCCLMWQDDCWNKGCAAIRQAIKILER